MSANINENYPPLLTQMVEIATERAVKHGLSQEEAHRLAFGLVEEVRKRMGGHLFYLPKGDRYDLSQRDLEIYGKFNGRNHDELATKYQLNVTQVYKIVARARSSDVKRRQVDAFPSD